MNNFISHLRKDLESINDRELEGRISNCKIFDCSTIECFIEESVKRNFSNEKIKILKDELNWRAKTREKVLSQNIEKKPTWGIIPTLTYMTNWKISKEYFYFITYTVMYIMFWEQGYGFDSKNSIYIQRPDAPKQKDGAKIKLKLNKDNRLIIKCIATGDLILDNERNIRSLKLFLKAFEIIAERENLIL